MKALLRKELRELAPWFALAAAFVVLDLAVEPEGLWALVVVDTGALAAVRGILVGVLLGTMQLQSERRRGTLSTLVHRDTGPMRAAVVKVAAALCVLAAAVVLPMVLRAMAAIATWELDVEPAPREIVAVFALAFAAYGVGAVCATWHGRASTRMIAAAGGCVTIGAACGFVLEDSALRAAPSGFVAAAALTGVALAWLASFRLVRGDDRERRPGPIETASCALVLVGCLLVPARIAMVAARSQVVEAGRWEHAAVWSTEDRARPPFPDWVEVARPLPGWTPVPGPWSEGAWWRRAFLDRDRGVVRAFDLESFFFAPVGRRVRANQHLILRPEAGPFSANALVDAQGRIVDRATGAWWTLGGDEEATLVDRRGEVDCVPWAGARPRLVLDDDLLARDVTLVEPESGGILVRWRGAKGGGLKRPLFVTYALFGGPAIGAASYAFDGHPWDALGRLTGEPLHAGRRRPGLLVVEVALALACAALAVRRLRRSGASRGRAATWAAGIVVAGPLGYVLVQLVEPRAPRVQPLARARMRPPWVAVRADIA